MAENTLNAVYLNKTDGTSTFYKKKGVDFRLLILTDLHFGCSLRTKKKDALTEDAIRKVIDRAKPDFIVVNGDLTYPLFSIAGTTNNKKQAEFVLELFESFNIPWAHTFGNHDEERNSKLNTDQLADIYLKGRHSLFEKGPEDIFGVGNYTVDLRNEDGAHNTTFFFIDSNLYMGKGFFSGFDHVHEDQIDWYKKTVAGLSAKEGKKINSLMFCHIPLRDFAEAWKKCWHGDKDVIYHSGFVQEKDNYFGFPKTRPTSLFNALVETDSTKGIFFGHDHYNCLSLTYRGIRMTYAMSVDYTGYIGIKKRYSQRGGTLVTIDDNGAFDVTLVPLLDIEPNAEYLKRHV